MVEVMMAPSSNSCGGGGGGGEGKAEEGQQQQQGQGQVLALVMAALRKSVVLPCQMADADDPAGASWGMEIGWPTDVRHVAHVTFDRLQGFLGLPVEFELEIPGQVPSASASVFGVSPESMQCGYDDKGNSVPKILLLMQERLYTQDGLKAEGIFRITPENSQEEHVREQLNSGIVPDDIDVHCLASLIKAWFRELPEGVLDSLSPEQVLHCNTEEQCIELVELLPPTQAALLNWVVELMADVVEEEESNKMNARNVAMVFAPNMTQMSDPLTALMHAVQVMNLLKTLILKTLRERDDHDDAGAYSSFSSSSSLSEELDEEGQDQQDDENDSGSENSNCDDNERPKDIDKAIGLRVDNERLIGVSRRHTSIECHLPYIGYGNGNEDTSLDDIEECFLRRLEWKAVRECVVEDDSSNFPPSNKGAEQLSTSESITEGSDTIVGKRDVTSNTIDVTINEPRQMEIRIEMTNAEVRSASKGELILCS
ncbi:Rho GTPase-activating protein 2 [Dichanthelium oligosanthes]|uniref:Rho GTPase-activating protein 2 n=1 Tax=Dichanthelium oligosanthes TaxID=888268 RepID=A0A1E5WJV6_9POAL|nr:Rho GTPase-activating protein 2 [Dichanthelium oligosanthes]